MGKLSVIIALINIARPFLTEILPLVKAMIEAIKNAKGNGAPLVGEGTPVAAADIHAARDALVAAGMPVEEAATLVA